MLKILVEIHQVQPDRQRVLDIINDIGSKLDKIVAGRFVGQGVGMEANCGDVFFRIKGNDVVTKSDSSFVTIFKDGVTNNTSVNNALKGTPPMKYLFEHYQT